jgi:uncharacterized protein (DUF433 family)
VSEGAPMDWTGCDFVEPIPGSVPGLPSVRGTRIPADAVVEYADQGVALDEILEDFPSLTIEIVQALVAFAHRHREAA